MNFIKNLNWEPVPQDGIVMAVCSWCCGVFKSFVPKKKDFECYSRANGKEQHEMLTTAFGINWRLFKELSLS